MIASRGTFCAMSLVDIVPTLLSDEQQALVYHTFVKFDNVSVVGILTPLVPAFAGIFLGKSSR